jgi:hypothetical protein
LISDEKKPIPITLTLVNSAVVPKESTGTIINKTANPIYVTPYQELLSTPQVNLSWWPI